MKKTPRTDAAVIATDRPRGAPVAYVTAEFARGLEMEAAALFLALKECVEALDICRQQHDGQGSYAYHMGLSAMKRADMCLGISKKPTKCDWAA